MATRQEAAMGLLERTRQMLMNNPEMASGVVGGLAGYAGTNLINAISPWDVDPALGTLAGTLNGMSHSGLLLRALNRGGKPGYVQGSLDFTNGGYRY